MSKIPSVLSFGFIGSSDNHGARPGTGYKEIDRMFNTEANGFSDPFYEKMSDLRRPKGELEPSYVDLQNTGLNSIMDLNIATDAERQRCIFYVRGISCRSFNISKERINLGCFRKKRGLRNFWTKNPLMV